MRGVPPVHLFLTGCLRGAVSLFSEAYRAHVTMLLILRSKEPSGENVHHTLNRWCNTKNRLNQ